MNSAVHFLNGQLVSEAQLHLSPRDLGYTRGYAVFDLIVTYHRHPFKLSDHLDRLLNSAKLIKFGVPWNKQQLSKWVYQTLDANKDNSEKIIKIIISGGIADSLLPAGDPTLVILIDPRPAIPEDFYTTGIGVITVKHTRYLPAAKTTNYIEGVKQSQMAKAVGAIEPIYYSDQQVFEGATSNIFILTRGVLKTTKTNILPGITRKTILEDLKLDVPVKIENFTIEELTKAREVFLTSSNREIVPVITIDGKRVNDGKVGAVTKDIMHKFKQYIRSNNWLEPRMGG